MHNAQFYCYAYYNESAPVAKVMKGHFTVRKSHICFIFYTQSIQIISKI